MTLRLWRGGGWVRRARLASGSVLFAYVTTHLLNHALGLVSIAAIERALVVQKAVWQGVAGSVALYAALGVHLLLGLWALYERRYFLWSRLEAVQLGFGLAIPVLLANHICVTRASLAVYGLQKGYAQELYALWVASGFWGAVQVGVLVAAWLHGSIGLYGVLRLRRWFAGAAPTLLVASILVPLLALLGFEQSGRTLARLAADPAWRADALALAHVGTEAQKAAAARWRTDFIWVYGAALTLVLLARGGRGLVEARRGRVRIAYPNGASVLIARGMSVLDASRIGRVAHASVCGGRGRCSTCRVRVLGEPAALPAPSRSERAVLDRVRADWHSVRLACQLRPRGDIAVLPLVTPGAGPGRAAGERHLPSAEERFVVALFADMRGSTEFCRQHLPFDNLFLLSTFIATLADAVTRAGGAPNQFMGDGILALFGIERDLPRDAVCRQSLLACRLIAQAVARFNQRFAGDLTRPIGFGIGVHAGPAIVGRIGYGRHVTLTALGDPVNIASRLQALTREHACLALVSEPVLLLAGAPPGRLVAVQARGGGPLLAQPMGEAELQALAAGPTGG